MIEQVNSLGGLSAKTPGGGQKYIFPEQVLTRVMRAAKRRYFCPVNLATRNLATALKT